MSKKSTGTTMPEKLTTALHPFFSYNSDQECLFSVRPDVPLEDALSTAGVLLSSAYGVVHKCAEEADTDEFWAATYLIEMCQAVVDASIDAVKAQAQREANHE